MADGAHPLHVSVSDERGRPVPAGGLAAWLRRAAPASARGHVHVAIVSDRRIRALNRTYRRKDYATDVLSFPSDTGDRARRDGRRESLRRTSPVARLRSRVPDLRSSVSRLPSAFLGDIVIARGVARRQARALGHSDAAELRVLALHGLLHLLGYDHEHDRGRMRKLEQRLLRKAGLRDGLINRTRGSTGSPRAGRRDVRPELVAGRVRP
jgi:probable rRNA maturation factor